MKNAIYAVIFSAALVGTASAAPQGAGEQKDAVSAAVTSTYELGNSEFDDYAKPFMLEDGRRVTFTQNLDNYYVQLDREPRMKMLPQAPGVFMTANGVRIQFRDDGDTVSIRDYEKLAVKGKQTADDIVMAKR